MDVLAVEVCELELELKNKKTNDKLGEISQNSTRNCMQNDLLNNAYELCAILFTAKTRTEPSAQQDANLELLEFHTILFTSAE